MLGLKIKGMKLAIYFVLGFFLILIVGLMYEAEEEAEQSNSGGSIGAICSTNGEIDQESWDTQFARSGVFQDKQELFVEVAEKNGIDPVLFAAIAFHETAYGKSDPVKEKNNPGGLMGSNGLMSFPTLDDGINSMGVTLHNRIIVDGLTTIEDLGGVYAPVGAANDPTNLNINWVPTTKEIVKKLGGLTMNCEVAATGDFLPPTGKMTTTSGYGYRIDPITGAQGDFHKGLDFACTGGDPISAADSGKVLVSIKSGWGGGYGHHVIIDHGDKFTLYGHLTTVQVNLNDPVEQGQQIGTCGTTGSSTGDHLHFEVQLGQLYGERKDPSSFFE